MSNINLSIHSFVHAYAETGANGSWADVVFSSANGEKVFVCLYAKNRPSTQLAQMCQAINQVFNNKEEPREPPPSIEDEIPF